MDVLLLKSSSLADGNKHQDIFSLIVLVFCHVCHVDQNYFVQGVNRYLKTKTIRLFSSISEYRDHRHTVRRGVVGTKYGCADEKLLSVFIWSAVLFEGI